MLLKKRILQFKYSYKAYLYYNLYIRHKIFIKRKQYSQWGEDVSINNFFKDKNNGIYLDIGCFHPYMYSNTCLLHERGWSGLNVDMNKTSIDLFNIVRPKDTNICAAISKKKENMKAYIDHPFSPVNTIDKKFYENAKNIYFKNKEIITIQTKTVQEILNFAKIGKVIDYINIDAEGFDYEILQQIDPSKYNVKLFSVETHNVDGSKSNSFDAIIKYFNKIKFSVLKKFGPTTLFARKA